MRKFILMKSNWEASSGISSNVLIYGKFIVAQILRILRAHLMPLISFSRKRSKFLFLIFSFHFLYHTCM